MSVGAAHPANSSESLFDIRRYGATGDGKTLDTRAIQDAIDAADRAGGRTVLFPAGTYASHSIHLKSKVALYLDQGATLLAASVPLEGTTSGGYDAAEPQGAWEAYQDYGHNHWHNSLLWGENLHDLSILGPGRIWGKGLSRGWDKDSVYQPSSKQPGAGNKSIALKLCRNVTLRDFQILEAGWFGILATGVDNLTIDNLRIDTNRDGMDIDCCRNVRVSNCTVNSPYDDGICPKSSFALGYARPTENVTITNCFVTGNYEVGSVLDGTWKPMPPAFAERATGRIKCGTESNGGFRNITISNCVFESCKGFALETADGAIVEDIVFSNISMRNVFRSPIFLYLGSRMRGPKDAQVGTLRRVLLSNIVSSHAGQLPSLMVGIAGHPIEDVKISDVYLHQQGGGNLAMAAIAPPIKDNAYPEPTMFGQLPATGFYLRHVRNLEASNIEIATEAADARAAFCLQDVEGGDFFRVRVPAGSTAFDLRAARNFRSFGSLSPADTRLDSAQNRKL
ncbi:MAG TPA: glycoside hydrolase family 28 protein [Acidobacteriaceae bacterium]